jgi:hypothetical protein
MLFQIRTTYSRRLANVTEFNMPASHHSTGPYGDSYLRPVRLSIAMNLGSSRSRSQAGLTLK